MKLPVWKVTARRLLLSFTPFNLLFDLNAYFAEEMRLALEKKDLDLAAAQKEAQEKTTLADKKLASVGALEEKVSKLKSSLTESN